MPPMNVHLPPLAYATLQRFVHGDHWRSFGLFTRTLDLSPGETVVEIGCGIGSLARHFIEQGFDYWGLDVDASRVEVAQRRNTGGTFLVCDALDLATAGLPPFRRVFIHGVLHHMADAECRQIFDRTLALQPDMVLSLIEPYRPDPWWSNPLGSAFSSFDEGIHVRTLEQWRALTRPNAVTFEQFTLWPRWPVGFLVARLVQAQPTRRERQV